MYIRLCFRLHAGIGQVDKKRRVFWRDGVRIPYFLDTMYALKGDFLLKRGAIGRKITALHCHLAVEFWAKKEADFTQK